MSDDKKLTTRAEDFAAWYNEVVLRAELADYSPVRGSMVIRPWGFGIWERLQAAMLSAAVAPAAQERGVGVRAAVFATVILGCGLIALIALTRTCVLIFWVGGQRQPPVVRTAEAVPIAALLAFCGLLTVAAGPTMGLAQAAARSLRGRDYVDAVLRANVSASPATPKGLGKPLGETPR